jgi:cysteinyl-tRNA synthetase
MARQLATAYDSLGLLPPTYEPLATGHVPEMVELIATLIERGHAYAAEDGSGDVYFDVRTWPAYGELSGQRLDEMSPAEDADPRGKRDPRDFALWKGHKDTEPETASWPTPWGRGRPGWHIECSAMAAKYLGRAFDIHGGGMDLRFPHHENEQAQSRAAGQEFASIWMHNAWITTAGEKMSKSLGNSLTVPAVLQRARPIELRYYMVSSHYRSHVEFSFESLEESATSFRRIEGFLQRAPQVEGPLELGPGCADFEAAMDDDLNTSAAMAAVHEVMREGNKLLSTGDADGARGAARAVRAMLGALGCDPLAEEWQSVGDSEEEDQLRSVVDSLVTAMLSQRQEARAAKDFATADAIRDQLRSAGVEIEDGPSGSSWALR